MCGIAGYFGPDSIPERRLAATLERMRRRGPDAAGCWQRVTSGGRHVYLLHTRLSIIDLHERANQPLRHGPHVIAYNGEVFNHLELRQSLEARGERFITTSDTEVLLRLLALDGPRALDRCEGMWAFAAFDSERESLLLCRDRFGEKPLYVYRDSGGIYFGSEIKFIVALLGRAPAVDRVQLRRYLVNGYKALYKQRSPFFERVDEVEPSTFVSVSDAGAECATRYWQPPADADPSLTYDAAVDGVRSRLNRAMSLRLRSDVPLAFCLSGGVDSNALIATARRRFGYDVHGFTVLNVDGRYDERDLVEHSIRRLELKHTWVTVSRADFLDNIRRLVACHDAPIYTSSYYVHWLLMEAVSSQGFRVSISGTAADELLSGYYDHHNLFLAEVHGTSAFEPALQAWRAHVEGVVRNPSLQNPLLYVERPDARDHIFLNSRAFAGYLPDGWWEAFGERTYSPSLLRNRMLNELFHESVPPMLHEDDLNAMYFSVENRSPYLDRELVEFCLRIPPALLMRDGFTKSVLRDAVRDVVPPEVLWNRRKIGFNAPVEDLVDRSDRRLRDWLLADDAFAEEVRLPMIEALLDKPSLPNSESKFLFNVICAKAFLEQAA